MAQLVVCWMGHRASLAKKKLRKSVIIFLPISFNMCCGCSKELSHWDSYFEYPQYMFWLRNKKFFSITHSYLELFGGLKGC